MHGEHHFTAVEPLLETTFERLTQAGTLRNSVHTRRHQLIPFTDRVKGDEFATPGVGMSCLSPSEHLRIVQTFEPHLVVKTFDMVTWHDTIKNQYHALQLLVLTLCF